MYLRIRKKFMQKLNLPKYTLKFKKEEENTLIFDPVRKKYLCLTPEEWVRQNFIQFLIQEKKYPISLMAIEKKINLVETSKRCDIVLYSNNGNPNIIVECKAPSIKISQQAFDQISRYNMAINANILIVTNGMEHYVCKINHKNKCYDFLKEIPQYMHD